MILKKPVITEKTIDQYKKEKKATFEVDSKANKINSKQALEKAYDVKVSQVWIINRLGKVKRNRITRYMSKLKDRKIAVFKISDGKIDIFEK